MSLSRFEMLDEMGLSPQWTRRESPSVRRGETAVAAAEVAAPEMLSEALPEASSTQGRAVESVNSPAARSVPVEQMDWDELHAQIASCRACGLCAQRKQAVPGVGDRQADWLFIGEGPGAEEDERGEPFVGQAGRLLDAMLAAIDLKRGEDVYIANAVKCRPPGNRTPEPAELGYCLPYLRRQIALIQPRLIILLGRAAAHSVLGVETSLASLRGKTAEYRNDGRRVPVIVTYHPAYLLRTLPDKSKAWEDLCRARALMGKLKAE